MAACSPALSPVHGIADPGPITTVNELGEGPVICRTSSETPTFALNNPQAT